MDLNGLTAEQFNAREKKRASIVAKIYGYVPMALRRNGGGFVCGIRSPHGETLGEPAG